MSNDGRYLYVNIDFEGKEAIQQVDLFMGIAAPPWHLEYAGDCSPINVRQMAAVPDEPEAVVVHQSGGYCSPNQFTAVYDKDGMRPLIVSNTAWQLEASDIPGEVFASGDSFDVLQVDAQGIQIVSSTSPNRIGQPFQYADGKLFTAAGQLFDATTLDLLGTFNVPEVGLREVLPDMERGHVYFTVDTIAKDLIQLFDVGTFRLIAEGAFADEQSSHRISSVIPIAPERFAYVDAFGSVHLLGTVVLDNFSYTALTADNFCGPSYDDFSTTEYQWPRIDNEAAKTGYVAGEFSIRTKTWTTADVRSPFCKRDGYRVRVDARWEGEPGEYYGIRYHRRDSSSDAPVFIVNPDKRGWRYYLPPSDYNYSWNYNNAILPGNMTNRIELKVTRWYIQAFVNGVEMHSWSISGPVATTNVALITGPEKDHPAAEARFDNFLYDDYAPGPEGYSLPQGWQMPAEFGVP